MSDAEVEVEGEAKKKSPLVKIIIFAVAGIVVLAGTVVGTMFLTGFFDRKDIHEMEKRLSIALAKLKPCCRITRFIICAVGSFISSIAFTEV